MSLYDGLKDAATVLKEAQKIEEYKQILEGLDELQARQKKIFDLEAEVKDLKDKLKTKENLKYERNSYFTVDNNDGPFCSHCWDAGEKLVRTHPAGNPAYHTCPKCKNTVQVYPEKDPPRPQHVPESYF